MLKVKNVKALDDYILFIEFSNGQSGYFDVKPYLDKGVFKALKDVKYFKQVRPLFSGISWPDEQDFSADKLAYEMYQKEALAS
jgi:hypothetical protein